MEAVSDAAYDQAVKVVARIAVDEAQKADQAVVDKMIDMVAEPERRLKPKERELISSWLNGVKDNFIKRAAKVFSAVLSVLQKPEYRQAAKAAIQERTKPTVRKFLETCTIKTTRNESTKRNHNSEAR